MGFKIKDFDRHLPMGEDQLLSRADQFWVFAEQHRGAIIGFLLLIGAAGIGLAYFIWHGQTQEEQAWDLQHQATQLYIDRPLDNPEKTAEHIQQAIELYQQIAQDFSRTPSAELAYFFIGNARIDLKQYQEAIQAYQQYVEQYGHNHILLGLVYQRLGYAYLLTGDREKAEEAFTQALAVPEALNKDQVLFEFAKLQEADGHADQSLTYYKDLINQYPNSPFMGEASLRVKALEPPEEEQAPEQSAHNEAPDVSDQDKSQESNE